MQSLSDNGDFDTETILSSMNADFYEFRISDVEGGANSDENARDEKPPKETIE